VRGWVGKAFELAWQSWLSNHIGYIGRDGKAISLRGVLSKLPASLWPLPPHMAPRSGTAAGSHPPNPPRLGLASLCLVALAALCAVPLCSCGGRLLRVKSRKESTRTTTPTTPTAPQPHSQSQPQAPLPQQSRPEPANDSPTRTAAVREAGLTLIPILFPFAQVVQKGNA
jgi:hypothetical protein